jgi:hypothetical protein
MALAISLAMALAMTANGPGNACAFVMLLVLFWQLALTGNGPGNACSGVARLCWAAFGRVWLCVTGRLCSVVLGCVGLPSAAQLCKVVLGCACTRAPTCLHMCPITLLWLAQALKGIFKLPAKGI